MRATVGHDLGMPLFVGVRPGAYAAGQKHGADAGVVE
jgi:hypothetical protein